MPVLIPALVSIGLSYGVAAVVAYGLEFIGLSLLSQILAPKANQGTQLSEGTTQEYSGTVEPRRIVYGEMLISGMNAIPPWCHGINNEMLDQVLTLAGHEVDAVTDVYAGQVLIPSSAIGAITQGQNDGLVTTGTFANHLWLRRHTGAAGELLDAILFSAWPGSWDANHVGQGIAKLYVQFKYDTTVFSGGKPDIRVMLRGKRMYDPRLDPAPGVNTTNPAYTRYSKNPALCIVDYLLDPVLGLGEAPGRIDWLMAVAAANCCDEQVQVPLISSLTPPYDASVSYVYADTVLGAGNVVYRCIAPTYNHAPPNGTYWLALPAGTLTQPRYTCDLVLDATADYETVNIPALAATMQGWVLYSSGRWVLLPGKWQAPSFNIGDDDIAGALSFQTAFAYKDRFNAVRGQFYDPNNLYLPGEYPAIRVEADELSDGEGPIWFELQQPGCTDQFEAQRNAIVKQRQSRRTKQFTFVAAYSLYPIRPGDFGTLSITELNVSGLYVKCTGWKVDGKAMTVQITLAEVNPADWFDPAVPVYQSTESLATPAPASFVPGPVTSLSGIGGAGGITIKWLMPPIWHSNLTVELIEADTNDYRTGSVAWSGVNTGAFLQKSDTTTRYYWVQVRNFAGNILSATNPVSITGGLALAAASIVGPPGAPGDTGPPGRGGLSGSLTLPSVTLPADASGHVASYAGVAGQFRVYEGTTDVTALCSFSIAPGGNTTGLAYDLGAGQPSGVGDTVDGTIDTAQGERSSGTGSAAGGGSGVVIAGATAQAERMSGTGSGGPVTGTIASGEAESASATAGGVIANYMIYSDGARDTVNFWGGAGSPEMSYAATITPDVGGVQRSTARVHAPHSYSLRITTDPGFGGGWQPASEYRSIPPNGFDARQYTGIAFWVAADTPGQLYLASHYARATGNDLAPPTSLTQGSKLFTFAGNTWTQCFAPFSNLALMDCGNLYKFAFGAGGPQNIDIDDWQFVSGETAWFFNGTGTPPAGWADGTPAGSTANYAFLPTSLSGGFYALNNPKKASQFVASMSGDNQLHVSQLTSGVIDIGDTLCITTTGSPPGTIIGGSYPTYTLSANASFSSRNCASAPDQAKVTAIKLTASVPNGMLRILCGAGFDLTPYDYLTTAVMPTKSGTTWQMKVYDNSGVQMGNAVTLSSTYTQHDFGVNSMNWTVYDVPISAFGLGSTDTIYSVSWQDTGANATNVAYFSQLGAYSVGAY